VRNRVKATNPSKAAMAREQYAIKIARVLAPELELPGNSLAELDVTMGIMHKSK
jgi:hypothetical protein